MAEPTQFSPGSGGADREEVLSVLFAQMVFQLSQMATMLLGKAPNPQSGEITRDLDGARMFIDQLEMLEVKTKGNLNREEEQLLKQSLMSLRMAFVEAIESATKETSKIEPAPESKPAAEPAAPAPDKPPGDDESKKKFTKKY